MKTSFSKVSMLTVAVALAIALMAVGGTSPAGNTARAAQPAQATMAATNPFLSMGDFNSQIALLSQTAEGDPKTPWLQNFHTDNWVDTTSMKKAPPWHICFSNASLTNNWRVSGFGVMQAEVKLHKEIGQFDAVDAQGKDEKQISDIDDLLTKKCDAIIIAPNTTLALTPEVDKAAKSGIPVIVFDRGVNTTAYTTFIHSIGGYAFGYVPAKYIVDQLKGKGNVLALRILPGVDVLENRWAAAQQVFGAAPGIKVVGVEFDDNDVAKTKSIVTDYIGRGQIDAVWMDAGEAAAGVYEAFVDAGQKVPIINAEDNNGWLKIWVKNNLNSISPTYPSYMWRTSIIAATMILSGQKVPKEWILPQPTITNDNVKNYVQTDLPDTYYVLSSGDTIPGYLDTLKTK